MSEACAFANATLAISSSASAFLSPISISARPTRRSPSVMSARSSREFKVDHGLSFHQTFRLDHPGMPCRPCRRANASRWARRQSGAQLVDRPHRACAILSDRPKMTSTTSWAAIPPPPRLPRRQISEALRVVLPLPIRAGSRGGRWRSATDPWSATSSASPRRSDRAESETPFLHELDRQREMRRDRPHEERALLPSRSSGARWRAAARSMFCSLALAPRPLRSTPATARASPRL